MPQHPHCVALDNGQGGEGRYDIGVSHSWPSLIFIGSDVEPANDTKVDQHLAS